MTKSKNKQTQQPKKMKKEKKKIKRDIAKVLNKDHRFRKRMLGMNPYARTLLDPFNTPGVKIPDEAQIPTVAFTVVDRRQLIANAGGFGAIMYGATFRASASAAGSLIPVKALSASTYDYAIGMSNAGDANAGGIFGTTTPPSIINLSQWSAANPAIPNVFSHVRLVSAGLNLQYVGNFTNNEGTYTAGFAPRGYFHQAAQTITLVDLQQVLGSRIVPINQNAGVTVTYEPTDEVCREFCRIQTGNGTQLAYDFSLVNVSDQSPGLTPGYLYVACTGTSPGAVFQITAVFNYEGIPVKNTFMLNGMAAIERFDPIALASAENLAAEVPNVVGDSRESQGVGTGLTPGSVDTSTISKDTVFHPAPSNEAPQNQSMLDFVLSGLDKLPQVVGKGIETFSAVSPLIEGALALI